MFCEPINGGLYILSDIYHEFYCVLNDFINFFFIFSRYFDDQWESGTPSNSDFYDPDWRVRFLSSTEDIFQHRILVH